MAEATVFPTEARIESISKARRHITAVTTNVGQEVPVLIQEGRNQAFEMTDPALLCFDLQELKCTAAHSLNRAECPKKIACQDSSAWRLDRRPEIPLGLLVMATQMGGKEVSVLIRESRKETTPVTCEHDIVFNDPVVLEVWISFEEVQKREMTIAWNQRIPKDSRVVFPYRFEIKFDHLTVQGPGSCPRMSA